MNKFIILSILALFLTPSIAFSQDKETCKTTVESGGYTTTEIHTKTPQGIQDYIPMQKEKLLAIAKELELSDFKIDNESLNIYNRGSDIDSSIPVTDFYTTRISLSFKFSPADKTLELMKRLNDEKIIVDITSETSISCE